MSTTFPLLALPAEIRVEIYCHLLPRTGARFAIRNVGKWEFNYVQERAPLRRTQYTITTGFRESKAMETTYCLLSPFSHTMGSKAVASSESWGPWTRGQYFFDSPRLAWDPYDANSIVALLQTNKLINKEATPVLYSHYQFDFGSHLEGFRHFILDLRPSTRRLICKVRLVKGALPFDRRSDIHEWAAACDLISKELDVASLHLELGVQGAQVAEDTSELEQWWDFEEGYRRDERKSEKSKVLFEAMVRRISDGKVGDWLEIEWIEELVRILKEDVNQLEGRKLKGLEVKAIWERCVSPQGEAMKWFVSFSEEIEHGLERYLKKKMVGGA
ncbi:hypothetical protein MMC10_006352 [Thelotrema lepadinum]|nr:hypothetical protein [Thelotrema lepadinum]